MHSGNLTLRVNDEEVKFNIYHTMKFPNEAYSCNRVDVVSDCIKGMIQGVLCSDPLEHCLFHSLFRKEILPTTKVGNAYCSMEEEHVDYVLAFESLPPKEHHGGQLYVIVSVIKESKSHRGPSSSSQEGLILKQLPEHLHYPFLGGKFEFPVIILASLSSQEEVKLLEVLRRHKSALGWSIVDIKGISPTNYMHKILIEESFKPSIEHQRRLNPAMKEVVRAKVLKLLNVGIIYAILDSSWVSPVQVVPKKEGMTVVMNEKNELIPTRTVTGWRVYIDYRKLNKAIRKDHFPLPFID